MMSKLASLIALSLLVLGATSAHAQEATSARRMPYPFPGPGSFSGRVLTRGFYPQPIPMGGNVGQPEIAPAPGGAIWNPNRPVAGAQVTISWRMPIYYKQAPAGGVFPSRTWNTTTDFAGNFSFNGLPNGSFTYKVRHGEFATASGSFSLTGRFGATQDIYLKRQVNQQGSFAGRVTVAPRWPILYAKPMAASAVDPGLAGAEAQAKADEAPLDPEEAAADKLTEPEPGATPPSAASRVAAGASPNSLTIAAPIYLGRGLANAQVEVTGQPFVIFANDVRPTGGMIPPPPAPRTWRATTDSNGNFGVKGLPSGRYTYRVTHKYFQPRGGSFTVGSAETDVYRTIQLERRVRGTFAGVVGEGPQVWALDTVRPASGAAPEANRMMPPMFKPLPGARIVAVRSRFMPFPRPFPGPIVYAREAIQPAAANASAAAPEAAPPVDAQASQAEDAELLKASETDGADTPATDDDKSDAALADAEGTASAAATDAVVPQSAGATATSAIAPAIARCLPIQWPVLNYRRATADQNGRFAISKLPAGTYRFVVREPNHAPQLGWFTISSTQTRVYRRILLQGRGGDLPPVIDPDGFSGQVLGYQMPLDVVYANGQNQGIRAPDNRMVPVAGAQVSMQAVAPPGMMVPQVLATTTTDANGYFQFRNATGRAIIYVDAKGYHPARQEVSRGSSGWTQLKIYLRPVFVGLPPVVGKQLDQAPPTGTSVEDAFGK